MGVPSLAWRATVARNEQWLQAERDRIQERIAGRRAELVSVARDQSEEGGMSNHEGDIGSEVATAEVLNAEIVRMEDELEAIHEALQMIRDGRYGICLRCGELIDPPRLRAYPLALRHARCQEEFELEIIPPAPRRSEI